MAERPPKSGAPDPAPGEPERPAAAAPVPPSPPSPPRPSSPPPPSTPPPDQAALPPEPPPPPPPPPDTPTQGAAAPGTDHPVGRSDRSDTTDDDFLALVAHFDEEPGDRVWPEAEDITTPDRPEAPGMPLPGRAGPPPVASGTGRTEADDGRFADGSGFAADDQPRGTIDDPDDPDGADGADGADGDSPGSFGPDDADEGHYTPPPPPPVPRMRPVTRWALGSIALGVAILFAPAMFGFDRDSPHNVVGVFLVLGGVGTLVARMGERRPTDADGPDDGAVV